MKALKFFLLSRLIAVVLTVGLFVGCDRLGIGSASSQARLTAATNKLAGAKNDQERFYALDDAAKQSFELGNVPDAKNYAEQLLTLIPKFTNDWNYGNAVQDANLVFGRIAVREGRIDDAKKSLLASAKSDGSPQMNSFGPNMSLAKDLLEKGEKDIVLQYFDLCRKFWKSHPEQLDAWASAVKSGTLPDFGANLVY